MSEEQQRKSHRLSPKARPRKTWAHLERKPLNGRGRAFRPAVTRASAWATWAHAKPIVTIESSPSGVRNSEGRAPIR